MNSMSAGRWPSDEHRDRMITSTANETIKHVTSLVKNAKARRKEGVFVVEGERIACEIPKDVLKECFVSEGFLADGKDVGKLGIDITPTVVTSAVFKKMSDTQNPQGILCVCKRSDMSAEEFLASRSGGDIRLLILEGIQDPGNLGTMVRTAEGAGFDAIIADGNTVDVYNPKVTRSTMGSVFRVPVIYTDDLPSFIDMLKKNEVKVYAAHLNGDRSFREEEYGRRIAFLIGNEGNGLSDKLCARADVLVRIPMKGKLESLNAAVAAALLMYNV